MTKCYDLDDAHEALGTLVFSDRTAISSTERCRHCGGYASVFVALPQGCFVFPNDRTQYLCAQHWNRLTPLDDEPTVAIGINGFKIDA